MVTTWRSTPGTSSTRSTAGDESEAYMDEADNVACVSIGRVLSNDDSFIDLLDAPIGAAFERDRDTMAFVREMDSRTGDEAQRRHRTGCGRGRAARATSTLAGSELVRQPHVEEPSDGTRLVQRRVIERRR